jgi:hypothetical protein
MVRTISCEIIEWCRHQGVGFPAGITEHDALVPGALVLVAGAINALGNIARLRVQMNRNVRGGPMEPLLLIADVADGHARQMRQQFRRDRLWPTGFAGQNDTVGGDE